MLPLPSPPTDNLYKFMAIAGLLLFGLGLVFPYVLEQQQIDLYYRKRQEINDHLTTNVHRIADIFIKENIQPLEKRQAGFESANESLAEFKKLHADGLAQEFERRSMLNWSIVDQFRSGEMVRHRASGLWLRSLAVEGSTSSGCSIAIGRQHLPTFTGEEWPTEVMPCPLRIADNAS